MDHSEDKSPMLSQDHVESNNIFDKNLMMMMMHPLTFSGQAEPEPENNDQILIGSDKGKKTKEKKRVPRIAFHTRCDDDVLDDGYRWRKYGQKSVKNNAHPRSYYRCTYHTCNVKKQVQRLAKDQNVVVTTYEGIHNHPCAKLMETLNPLLRQLQFLSTFTNL